ncbi:hypothetical protein BGZ60DRAFT_435927 [Tricladium varicosporioides]|nr:hypothetical protein BGZ60DRAFT_435927 [Hymenoscyphus varicosporioides]
MATDENGAGGMALENTNQIPIAQLSTQQSQPASTSIRAIVSLTWPYSSATGSVAFLLSEPDFRLRRSRGQVRVQFSGSSGKRVAKSAIASGDEVLLSLDGVEFVEDATQVATPGKSVEFELKFTERLLLQFRADGSQDIETIDIDHPAAETETAIPTSTPPDASIGFPSSPTIQLNGGISTGDDHEDSDYIFSSPAFVKRARTSYGSLFETNPWTENDGSVDGKRKRIKTGSRLSSSWRISSRSPSPESDSSADIPLPVATPTVARKEIVMTDEGCQTMDIEDGDAAETLASLSSQLPNTGSTSYTQPRSASDITPVTPISNGNPMQPPLLRTHFADSTSAATNSDPAAPPSPRLQPQSSEFLAMVSPLVATRYDLLTDQLEPSLSVPITEVIQDNFQNRLGEAAPENNEDLYSATPPHRDAESSHEISAFSNSTQEIHSLVSSTLQNDTFMAENLYNQLGDSAGFRENSPRHSAQLTTEMREMNNSYDEDAEAESDVENEALSVPPEQPTSDYQYPDPDDVQNGHTMSGWKARPSVISYPDLPEPQDEIDLVSTQYLSHQARSTPAAMSRSQSAQSPVVDLTESDDDEEISEQEEGSERDQELSENENSTDEDGYQEKEVDEEDYHSKKRPGHQQRNDLGYTGEYSQEFQDDEEGYDEDEYEEDENGEFYERTQFQGFDDDSAEEESIEDDSSEDDRPPQRSAVQVEPVVINLLSSDDEDAAGESVLQSAQQSRVSDQPSEIEEDEEEHNDEGSQNSDEDSSNLELALANRLIKPTSGEGYSEEEADSSEDEENHHTEELKYSENNITQVSGEDNPSVFEEVDSSQSGINEDPLKILQDDSVHAEANRLGEGSAPHWELNKKVLQADTEEHVEEQVLEDEDTSMTEVKQTNERVMIEEQTLASYHEGKVVEATASRPLLSKLFGIDGANDQPESYKWSKTTVGRNPSQLSSNPDQTGAASSYFAGTQSSSQNDTQRSENIFSTDASFSMTMDSQDTTIAKDVSSQEPPELMPEDLAMAEAGELSVATDILHEAEIVEKVVIPSVVDVEMASSTDYSLEKKAETLVEEDETTVSAQEAEFTAESPSQQLAEDQRQITDDENKLGEEFVNTLTPQIQDMEAVPAVAESDQDIATEGDRESLRLEEVLETAKTEGAQSESDKIELSTGDNSSKGKVQSIKRSKEESELATMPEGTATEPETPKRTADEKEPSIPEPTTPTPRRSHRRIKSNTSTIDTKENVNQHTPAKSGKKSRPNSARTDKSLPIVVIDDEASPKGYDASVEFALSSLNSPSKQHDLRKPPTVDLKLRILRALRTELSEFTSLKMVRYHQKQKLDVLAIATTTPAEPERAKGGPRNYKLTFNITDPSIAPSGVTEVQVFRPYREALPVVHAGDGILLRNFELNMTGGIALRSTQNEGSSWVVFKEDGEAEVKGPPVEFGVGESNHILDMKSWYKTLDATAMTKIARANADKGTSLKSPAKSH